jgi:hypothetical protein
MIAISDGIIQDGFSIFLLIAAFAFLWFRKPANDERPQSRTMETLPGTKTLNKQPRKAA